MKTGLTMSETETVTDTKTGEVYTVETEQRKISELFPWFRGTPDDRFVTVGRLVKKSENMNKGD